METKLIVSGSPHMHTRESASRIMWMVVLSLVPAGLSGIWIFGKPALWTILLAIASALFAETGIQFLTKRKISVLDGSAFLTGLLLAYNLGPNVPFWIPIIGSFAAIAVGKMVFGGLGQNIFNPALVGRVFLMASWPKYMTTFIQPFNYDTVTQATPLALLKEGKVIEHINYLNLFLGNHSGCIGEVSILALLLGAAFLLLRGYISWHIPVSFIAATAALTYLFAGKSPFSGDWIFHILSGGLILGAFFMATDYVTSPLTRKGHIIFGVGCGLLTAVIRIWGGYPEGVSYAILMMNAAAPLIDRFTKNRVYGVK
jgi:Na+-translocating ferredoxin:NAD+ oxidoreductase subunit D